jgi:LmbE family N-acetylglucosaminyl deacetylase
VVDVQAQSFETPLINGEGTSEFRWHQCHALAALPELTTDDYELAIVVAPHPDDETLALGGAIASMANRGMAVVVVTVSDGEASHPFSQTVTPDELRDLRRGESRRAMRALSEGLAGNVLNVQLHLRDGHLHAVREDLTDQLVKYLTPQDLCFAPWEFDGHPDHEAAGRAAAVASEESGARLLQYPVWMWHWATPEDQSIPWQRARRIELSREDRRRKERAIGCYQSQTFPLGDGPGDEPVMAPTDLLHFQRPYEVVFV